MGRIRREKMRQFRHIQRKASGQRAGVEADHSLNLHFPHFNLVQIERF